MTTIAVRDGIIAADSQCSYDGHYCGLLDKIHRLPDGRYFAGTGAYGDMIVVSDWLRDGGRPSERPGGIDGFCGFILCPDGTLFNVCDRLRPWLAERAPFHAIGSGASFALGAMAAGASAFEAVQIACRFDHASCMPVLVREAGT